MKVSCKLAGLRLFCFFAFVLGSHAFHCDLHANAPKTQFTIEEYALQKALDQLLLLIQKRLVIMHEVAKTKWNEHLSIEDAAREQKILVDFADKARAMGLDERWVLRFFRAQMEAAKTVQSRDIAAWKKEDKPPFDQVFSLKGELREYIDQINKEMMALFGAVPGLKDHFILEQPISNRGSDFIETDVWQLAIAPLKDNLRYVSHASCRK